MSAATGAGSGPVFSVRRAAPTGGGCCLELAGELDLAGAPRLEAALDDALAAAPERVDLDLARLDFLDSSGIAVLVRAWNRARHTPTRLSIHDPVPAVARTLEVAGVMELLTG